MGLGRMVLRLLGAVVGPWLRLNRTGFGLHWASLRWGWADVRLHRLDLGLSGPVVWVNRSYLGFAGAHLRLTRPYFWLAWVGWLDLRPVVGLNGTRYRFARPTSWLDSRLESGTSSWLNCWLDSWLNWADFGLARTVSGIGPREAGLGGDGPRSSNHGRAASVHVVELLTVLRSFALVLDLSGHGRNSWTAHGSDLGRLRSDGDPASASVVGDASVVVDDYCAVVDVGDVGADAVNGAVVIEVVAIPIAAVIADASVAEAVVDASVKTNVKAPESTVEAPAVVIPAPITGGPKGTVVGRSTPCAGDPVVAGGTPIPVAGGPDVVWRGGFGLLVNGQWRRRLVGVFDRRGLAFFIELLGGLSVLIGLIRIRRGWRSGLLSRGLRRRILLVGLLGRWGLGANSENRTLSDGGGSGGGLVIVDRRHVSGGGIGARIVGGRRDACGVEVAVATYSDEGEESE